MAIGLTPGKWLPARHQLCVSMDHIRAANDSNSMISDQQRMMSDFPFGDTYVTEFHLWRERLIISLHGDHSVSLT